MFISLRTQLSVTFLAAIKSNMNRSQIEEANTEADCTIIDK